MKRIAILGSTGSIGCSALDVVEAHGDRLSIAALAAGENADLLAEQTAKFRPRFVSMANGAAVDALRSRLGGSAPDLGVGSDGLVAAAAHPDVDIVLCATSGTAALDAVLAAIEARKTIALANKEVLVMAGGLVTDAARRCGVAILPVDSEHNAIHQCLDGRALADVSRIILTASGGPFRGRTAAELSRVTPADALRHPTWRMGRKITIDSATLMNKGLEVIEAHWLFNLRADQIDVIIHPQSVVHSMVEFRDGSIIAQLGVTDMRLPIQYAFSYPERWHAPTPPLDLARAARLEFEPPDHDCFPCLRLAYRALAAEASAPVVLNAANEAAVAAYLNGAVAFPDIPALIARALDAHTPSPLRNIADIRRLDAWARSFTEERLRGVEFKGAV